MFTAQPLFRYDKRCMISDSASSICLWLDTDDVDPNQVNQAAADRIAAALNREFYPDFERRAARQRVYADLLTVQQVYQEDGDGAAEDVLCDEVLDELHARIQECQRA